MHGPNSLVQVQSILRICDIQLAFFHYDCISRDQRFAGRKVQRNMAWHMPWCVDDVNAAAPRQPLIIGNGSFY